MDPKFPSMMTVDINYADREIVILKNRNFQRGVTAWIGWQRRHHYITRAWPGKNVVFTGVGS